MTYPEGFHKLAAELRETAAVLTQAAERFERFAEESATFKGRVSAGWTRTVKNVSQTLKGWRESWGDFALRKSLKPPGEGQ